MKENVKDLIETLEDWGHNVEDLNGIDLSEKDCKNIIDTIERLEEMATKSYWCYSVKELAYKVAETIYNGANVDYYICYKLVGNNSFCHHIAVEYYGVAFTIKLGWVGNSLSIDNDFTITKEVDEDFEDIDCAIENEDFEE